MAIQRTAMGRTIDMDSLRLSNEETIAVGNMKVNARGDELGFGGQIVKPRNQIMDEYYKLNTPTVSNGTRNARTELVADTAPVHAPVIHTSNDEEPARPLRGTLASTVIKK